jgi:hypothetical protein
MDETTHGAPPAARPKRPARRESAEAAVLAKVMAKMTALLEQLAAGQEVTAEAAREALEASRRQLPPSNATHPDVSPFNPLGDRDHPRPELVCRMFLPWEAERASLTWEEIELLNLLAEAGSYEYTVAGRCGCSSRAGRSSTRSITARCRRCGSSCGRCSPSDPRPRRGPLRS